MKLVVEMIKAKHLNGLLLLFDCYLNNPVRVTLLSQNRCLLFY